MLNLPVLDCTRPPPHPHTTPPPPLSSPPFQTHLLLQNGTPSVILGQAVAKAQHLDSDVEELRAWGLGHGLELSNDLSRTSFFRNVCGPAFDIGDLEQEVRSLVHHDPVLGV